MISILDARAVRAERLSLEVSEQQYSRLLGLPSSSAALERFRPAMEEARDWYARNGRPHLATRRVNLEHLSEGDVDGVLVSGRSRGEACVRLESRALQLRLRRAGCLEIVIAAASAGPELELETSTCWQERPDRAWFLGRFGSALVEHLVAEVGASPGLLAPMAPGYVGWDISQLDTLLGAMNEEERGPISLTSAGMLSPANSMAVVFGVLPGGSATEARRLKCVVCPQDPCDFRSTT